MWQGEDAVAITTELPGLAPSDIEITVKNNVLTLTGERRPPELPEGAQLHRSERSFGRFSRAIRLPFTASEERVEARFQHGVLRILVGRPEEDKPRKIHIKAA